MLRALFACLCCTLVFANPCKEMPLKLNQMAQRDQLNRQALRQLQLDSKTDTAEATKLRQQALADDTSNQATLKRLLAQCGWPKDPGVRHDAWLITQHAGQDRPLQRKVLALMQALPDLTRSEQTDLAYLEDRLNRFDNKPQRYGTQFLRTDRCTIQFAPIDDLKAVEQRRQALGLPPTADYLADLQRDMPKDCPRLISVPTTQISGH
ncbi:DUF6624 domain-containing protein [Chitinimonas sp.]|uniref:DUF6624 domain-containing protein n=1 Tax=Chitinimonas sp. TaxID=1934313 RepID=UPI002F931AFA